MKLFKCVSSLLVNDYYVSAYCNDEKHCIANFITGVTEDEIAKLCNIKGKLKMPVDNPLHECNVVISTAAKNLVKLD